MGNLALMFLDDFSREKDVGLGWLKRFKSTITAVCSRPVCTAVAAAPAPVLSKTTRREQQQQKKKNKNKQRRHNIKKNNTHISFFLSTFLFYFFQTHLNHERRR